jgi:Ca2+-binding RTX toxin-like protein
VRTSVSGSRAKVVAWALSVGLVAVAATTAIAAKVEGGPKDDRLQGTNRADLLSGRAGNDALAGRGGADVLRGGKGRDVLRGGAGRDGFAMRAGVELAEPGRDRILARDGKPDEINCGSGRDVAVVDAVEDGVYACEVVREPASGAAR